MKKRILGLSVILIALVATVCTSCKKEEPNEPEKFDLSKVNFASNEHFWVLTKFYWEDIDPQDAQIIDQGLPNNAGIDFQSERAMYVYAPLFTKPYPVIWETYVTWTSTTKKLEIETGVDIYTGTVVLNQDKEKVYFEYVGKSQRGGKDFTMGGYKLIKDFK